LALNKAAGCTYIFVIHNTFAFQAPQELPNLVRDFSTLEVQIFCGKDLTPFPKTYVPLMSGGRMGVLEDINWLMETEVENPCSPRSQKVGS
jgi:hypothetical protein